MDDLDPHEAVHQAGYWRKMRRPAKLIFALIKGAP
jgi:hypothetical protein